MKGIRNFSLSALSWNTKERRMRIPRSILAAQQTSLEGRLDGSRITSFRSMTASNPGRSLCRLRAFHMSTGENRLPNLDSSMELEQVYWYFFTKFQDLDVPRSVAEARITGDEIRSSSHGLTFNTADRGTGATGLGRKRLKGHIRHQAERCSALCS